MTVNAPMPYGAVPSKNQLMWHNMQMYAFIHFTINTFTDKEWGDGSEEPSLFNPTELDCEQWCKVISQAGCKGVILTAKHHDGFCLWPSKFTEHSVANSKWRDGKGDVVGELAKAAKKYNLKLGLYLSPWDRHDKRYGTGEAYNEYFCNQLEELFTTYGGKNGEDLFLAWFDGACGEGANGKKQVYDFAKGAAVVRKLAPNAVIFGEMGEYRDIRWCGNERGYAGETNWSTISEWKTSLLENGEPNTKNWWPAEVDVSIRPGWFYHQREDSQVRSLESMLDIWYHSIGRGSCLNLNFPPDRRGQIHENDALRVKELRAVLDKTFAHDFALDSKLTASDERGSQFKVNNLIDGKSETYWATNDDITQAEIIVALPEVQRINVIQLKEFIELGQRVAEFNIEYKDGDGKWQFLVKGTTININKILRTPSVNTSALKLNISKSLACPCIQMLGVFYQPPLLFAPEITRDINGEIRMSAATEAEIHYTLDGSAPDINSPVYVEPLRYPQAGRVRAVSILREGEENHYPEIETNSEATLSFGRTRCGMTVLSADSEIDQRGHNKENVLLDGSDFWLTEDAVEYPHHLTIDLGEQQELNGFVMTPTLKSEFPFGAVAKYNCYVSDNKNERGVLVSSGAFDNMQNNPVAQVVKFTQKHNGRYLTFEGLESADSKVYMCIKLFEVF